MYRRSRRVLPAYYAALLFSIGAIVASSAFVNNSEVRAKALSPGSVLSHVLLIHNWNVDWVFRINGPMWSVATEWQIYFLFPFVFLPGVKRIGIAATVVGVWLVALSAHFLLPPEHNLAWASPWFAGSFAIGMWGAMLAFHHEQRATRLARAPWATLAISMSVSLVVILTIWDERWPLPLLDLIVSIGSAAGILACVAAHRRLDAPRTSEPPWWYSAVSSRHVVRLGAISYSTYLLQHPLLRLTEQLLNRTGLDFESAHWVQLFVGTPLILTVSWLFAEFFELPFTSGSHILDRFGRRRPSVQPTESVHETAQAGRPNLQPNPLDHREL